jgi:hypothetical protein
LPITGSTEYEKWWYTNGKITSIQDLYGSQLLLLPSDSSDFELPEKLNAQLPEDFKEDPLKKQSAGR